MFRKGLFHYSTELINKLNSYVSRGISEEENVSPEEKYDIINQSVKISINGYQAENIAVTFSRGNGHIDYRFTFDGIPIFKLDEIKEIHFSVDENKNAEKYQIVFPVYESDIAESIIESLRKNYDDYGRTYRFFDDYGVIDFREVPRFGKVISHLYIVRLSDKEILYDVSPKVREFAGYDYDDLVFFDVKVGAIKNNIFFACNSPEKNGNFYVEAPTGTVHLISEYNK